ncbi:hypothetical protein BTM312_15390 [Helicobacter pylori]
MTNAPKVKDKPTLQGNPKLLSLGELWLINYFSIEKTTLNPLKEILMYNTNQEFLSCFLFMINPFKNRFAPYRNYGAQQTPLKHP